MVELATRFRSSPSDVFEPRHAATQSVTAAKVPSRAVHPFRECLPQNEHNLLITSDFQKINRSQTVEVKRRN